MLKIFAMLMIGILASSGVWADAKPSLKDKAVEQMFVYGKTLYERGNRVEAAQVFKRVALYNPDYEPLKSFMLEPTARSKSSEATTAAADASDPNADLKQALVREDAAIAQLKQDINHLRIGLEAHQYE